MGKSIKTLSDLQPDPQNANKGTPRGHAVIEHSVRQRGAGRSGLAAADGTMIAGSQTLLKMAELGIPVKPVHTTGDEWVVVIRDDIEPGSEQAQLLAAEDNQSAAVGLAWDADVLAALGSKTDLSHLFHPDELAALLASVDAPEAGSGGDAFDTSAALEGPCRVAPNELWLVDGGRHRLYCGDSTDAASVARLMDGERAQGVFTSPPYAEQRKEQYGGTPADEYVAWFSTVQEQIAAHLAPDGSFFVNIKEHSEDVVRSTYVHELVVAMVREWGWTYLDEFCWERTGIPGDPVKMGKLKNQWEPVFWFAKTIRPKFHPQAVMHQSDNIVLDDNYQPTLGKSQGTGRNVLGNRRQGAGMAYPGNRIRAGNAEALGHPAAFPVGLPEFFLKAFSDTGDIWLDPFAGSGTTMIAASRLGRRAFLCELSPAYASVCISRAEAEGLSVARAE